ncbi:MAG: LysR family transcriptional regulator [Beijerinckiaceae bacterium]
MKAKYMDHLTALRVFCAIVREGSFSGAAKALKLSNAAASKNISELEAYLGAQLVVRSTRQLKLTEGGKAFFDRISSVLSRLDEAEDMLADQSREPGGTLHVTLPVSLGIVWVAPLLQKFRQQYPGINLNMDIDDTTRDIIKGGYDLAIRGSEGLPDSSFRARKLATFDRILCASPSYLEAHGPLNRPHELSGHCCVAYRNAVEPDIWRFTGIDGEVAIPVRPVLSLNNSLAIVQAVQAGTGLAILPLPYVEEELVTGKLVHVLPQWKAASQTLYAIYPATPFLPKRIGCFVDFLIENLPPKSQSSVHQQ